MWIITKLSSYKSKKKKPLVLTLGTFDGLHLGHQHLLSYVKKRAKKVNGEAVVLTFTQHPLHVLKHKIPPALISSSQHRLLLLKQFGIDGCFLIRFTSMFSKQTPEDFVKKILVKQLNVSEVVLGYDSRFGKDRAGTADKMLELSKVYGFKFTQLGPKYFKKDASMSSTIIRKLILQGYLKKASKYLGRDYSILGNVVHGSGMGKKLGFPTANLNPHSEALPPRGVYLVQLDILNLGLKETKIKGQHLLKDKKVKAGLWGLLNIGYRPTIHKKKHLIPELHILNFKGNLYGKTIEVTFKKKIRDEKKFSSVDKLKIQIKKDVKYADKHII